jgi:hypothetical protein
VKGLNWRFVLITAGVLGLLGGILPAFLGDQYLFTTLPIAMMFSSFFLVPRIQERRLPSAIWVSLLTAAFALAVFFGWQYATLDPAFAAANLKSVLYNLPFLILIISLFGSFVFVKVHEWTERKKAELEAKVAQSKAEKKGGRNNAYAPHATKKRYRNTKKKKK